MDDLYFMKYLWVRCYFISNGEKDEFYKYVISNTTIK